MNPRRIKVGLELTSKCNLRCGMCPLPVLRAKKALAGMRRALKPGFIRQQANWEAALSQPPQTKASIAPVRGLNVGEQRIMRLERLFHAKPSSFLTMPTPATMLASFCLAAHRAV